MHCFSIHALSLQHSLTAANPCVRFSADSDQICGNEDTCPYDSENDSDRDLLCGDVDSCPYDVDNDEDSDAVCSLEPISFSRLDSLQHLRATFPVPKMGNFSTAQKCMWDNKVTARAFGLDRLVCMQATQVRICRAPTNLHASRRHTPTHTHARAHKQIHLVPCTYSLVMHAAIHAVIFIC